MSVAVDVDDLRVVLDALGRTTIPEPRVVAAANRLRSAFEPTLFPGAALSDPSAELELAHHGRETERAAAWATMPRAGTQRLRVLLAIALAGDAGRTDEELELGLEMRRPSPGNRRGELVAGGWVRDSGRTRPTTSGSPAVVWILTEAGAARLAETKEPVE